MKIYFACAIVGGRQDEAIYQKIVNALLEDGHDVPTALNAGPGWQTLEGSPEPSEVYQRDLAWIDDSDALIAEVSTPSHGVGYEIGYALNQKKPVLCIYRRGARVSKMLTGNTMAGILVLDYEDADQAIRQTWEFLRALELMLKP